MKKILALALAFAIFFSTLPLPAEQSAPPPDASPPAAPPTAVPQPDATPPAAPPPAVQQPAASPPTAPATEHKPFLAVMDFKLDEGMAANLSRAISDKIRETLMSTGKYSLIDRGNMEVIMSEVAHGQSGCFDESCAVQAGQLLSAQFIITGAVTELGPNQCQLSAQMTDVARAEIVKASSLISLCEGRALSIAAENIAYDLAGMPREPGNLNIKTSAKKAVVFVDGERAGQAPLSNFQVKPGQHKVKVSAQGYKSEEQTVNVSPGAGVNLQFSLVKEKKKWYKAWWFYTALGLVVAGGAAAALAGGSHGGGTTTASPTPTGTLGVSW